MNYLCCITFKKLKFVEKKRITIAVDGYSSCGKSTFAKQIAEHLNYLYIDSGAMYRAVTLAFIRAGITSIDDTNENQLQNLLSNIEVGFVNIPNKTGWFTTLNGKIVEEKIRTLEVSNMVSPVSTIPLVRKKMTQQQQEMGKKKGTVMDGRDIGTVVFPDAELKIFMTADPVVRAKRRLKEMQQKGGKATLDEVLMNIEERDYIDQNRAIAPLRQAEDAIVLDNSHMTVEEQMVWFEKIIEDIL